MLPMGHQTSLDHSLLDNSASAINILAVEDDAFSMAFLEAQVEALGHSIEKATNGQEAITQLKAAHQHIDVVLMDREMPVMNGLEAVKYIKDDHSLRHIPIIMVTGADSKEDMKEGLDAGVFYYITKPVDETILRSVLAAAVREAKQRQMLSQELSKHHTSFYMIDTAKFMVRTLEEAESLAAFMAHCFPNPDRVITGLGELLVNAVEHGNLGLGYDEKTTLIEQGTWRAEMERRQSLPHYQQTYATATIARKEDGLYVVIKDQGQGFNWRNYMQIDPSRAGDNHGRGIAQANALSFDRLTFNDVGNQVVAFVSHAA